MGSVCAEQQEHKFHTAHQLYLGTKKSVRDLDIPPRKLLSRRLAALNSENAMEMYQQQESPRVLPEETLFQKFLPYNSGVDADGEDADPYSADHFRMYEFKVRKCTRSRSHDWTDCPFAHPGEKARRRCPRRYNYSGAVCADFRRGSCSRGDLCEFAHGVFECWLHPSRYRTEACKDGKNCQRKICFFAHTPKQLRVLPPVETIVSPRNYVNPSHCCAHCRCHSGIHHTISPTSTLNFDMDNLSPPASPPFSPAQPGAGFSPISRFADRFAGNGGSSYQDSVNEIMKNHAFNELLSSMEAMNLNDVEVPNLDQLWVDPSFNGGDDQQPQFVLSPSTPTASSSGVVFSDKNNVYEDKFVNESTPDLGWVNDLLT